MPHWRRLDMHLASLARAFARLKAGSSSEARMAMMAITTNNSISVKARRVFVILVDIPKGAKMRCAGWTDLEDGLFTEGELLNAGAEGRSGHFRIRYVV